MAEDQRTVYNENHPLIRILNDGSPEAYETLANIYDRELAAANSKGPQSITHEWSQYYDGITTMQKVFDAGCGTGRVAVEMRKLPYASLLKLYGGDLSPDMIEHAKPKNVYDDLQVMNLKEPLPYEEGFFDSIISSGTFLQNHCSPECLPNITRVLKVNGYIVASVRIPYWEENKSEWERISQECNLELIKLAQIPYLDTGKAYVMVFRKTAALCTN